MNPHLPTPAPPGTAEASPGRRRRIGGRWALALALAAVVALAAGCGGSSDQATGTTATAGATASAQQTVTITDQLGRQVEIPRQVDRVVGLLPIPNTILSRLALDKMASIDKVYLQRYIGAPYTSAQTRQKLKGLPVIGPWFMGVNAESVLAANPDVVVDMVDDPKVESLQKQLGVPVVAVSKSPIADYEGMIRILGQVVGDEQRANEMADFWASRIAQVKQAAAKIPESERPSVVYLGTHGTLLQTPGMDTVFGSIIELAGGRNVTTDLSGQAHSETIPVTIEQIAKWDPDVIIAETTQAKHEIMTRPEWSGLRAVRDKRVYVPLQFADLDMVQAILGLRWTQEVLSSGDPDAAKRAVADDMRRFYDLFYGYQITDAQLAEEQHL
ncbi:MAG: ABC transporter substrate-binding protein [Solirubrobacteraceae bacterium]